MKKQIISVITLLIVLIIAGYYFFNASDDHLSDLNARNFKIEEIEKVDKIFLADSKGHQVTLTKDGTVWRVNGEYTARSKRIENLLNTAQNLEVKQRVPKSKLETIIKTLITKNIKAEFYQNNELIKTYFVGNADGNTTGTYMLLIDEESGENYATPFTTHLLGFEGYLTPRYEPDPKTWRDLKLFYFPKNAIASVQLNFPENPSESFELKLDEIDYKLYQNGKVIPSNPIEIKKYLLNFKSISAERLVSDETKDSLFTNLENRKPWFTLSVTNLIGKTTTVKAYRKPMPPGSKNAIGMPLLFDPDRFYGVCFDNEIAILQHFVFDPLLVKKSDLE